MARKSGAPEDKIEITPVMIDAGVRVLYESGAIENPIPANDRELVRDIYLQMYRERPSLLDKV